jgi:hypothetical protein
MQVIVKLKSQVKNHPILESRAKYEVFVQYDLSSQTADAT